jgi:hypothetical protein
MASNGNGGITAVATSTIDAMKSTPLAVALLAVNMGFLGFTTYLVSEATKNARIREAAHNELVLAILKECAPATVGGIKEP